jgi:hypothetical protein
MFKQMLKKLMITFHKLYKKIIKIIKALLGVITVLMSYKLVNYLFKFNKLIFYLFGLIFVGFNWNDYHVLNEMKLIWDSVKLYFLTFFPNNEITDEMKVSTKKDIKEIINYKDHTNINGKIDDDYVYVIADKIPEIKTIRNEMKESLITDGFDNSWTFSEILSNPLVIFAIVSAITITGIIIINIYDPNLEVTTTYTWTHIKAGITALVLFIGKLIRWISGRGNDPRPPIEPNDSPIDIDPNLTDYYIKGKGKSPVVSLKAYNVDGPIFGPDKQPFFDTIQNDPVLKTKEDILNKLTEINSHMNELSGKPSTSETAARLKFLIKKSDDLKEKYVQFESNPFGSGDSTPTAFRSPPLNTNDLDLPGVVDMD